MTRAVRKTTEDEKNLSAFGRHLVELRKKHNPPLSQEELAHLCDLDRTYISGIENGKRNVGLANIFRIAKALKIETSQLFNH